MVKGLSGQTGPQRELLLKPLLKLTNKTPCSYSVLKSALSTFICLTTISPVSVSVSRHPCSCCRKLLNWSSKQSLGCDATRSRKFSSPARRRSTNSGSVVSDLCHAYSTWMMEEGLVVSRYNNLFINYLLIMSSLVIL